jgi:tRNA threonylcarbamoyladenosine biosynthesis protein TsaB
MILCLETATNLCSVALCNSAGVISLRESDELKSHASMLTVFIDEILKKNGIKASNLDAIAVSKGPGSYTGLRIGVSVAKGMAYAASLPLIGIETTLSMFMGFLATQNEKPYGNDNIFFCPMLDARRMEVYYSVYDSSGNSVKGISAEVINEDSFNKFQEDISIIFFGNGVSKCKEVIKRKNVHFVENFRMSASHMLMPVFQSFNERRFEDIAYFEPFYLKDFITTKPGKNILGK